MGFGGREPSARFRSAKPGASRGPGELLTHEFMPLIDMPLAELERYQGLNPRPADFDAYWERGLAEMRALDPQVELVPAKLQTRFAECFHLYFTGTRGARIHAKLIRPREIRGK